MAILNIPKNDTTRVYYKSDSAQTSSDVRFEFFRLNGSPLVIDTMPTGSITARGLFYYDLLVPDEDTYIVGRGYVDVSSVVTEAKPLALKAGNATPQTLLFYSEKEFVVPPTYRIYNLLGVDLQLGSLSQVPNTNFWQTPFTANVGAPALQTDDVFFFEVEDELLAEGFTLDTSESGIISFQGIATISVDGTVVPSDAGDVFGKVSLEATASLDVSAVVIPTNVIEIEEAITCNDPFQDALNNSFQKITNRLNRIRSTSPEFAASGGEFTVVNILHDKQTLPNISIVTLTNKISKLGQIVPIIPVGGRVQNEVPLSVSIDLGQRLSIASQQIVPESPKGGSVVLSNKIAGPVAIVGNILVDYQKITALGNITPIPVTGGSLVIDTTIKSTEVIDGVLKTTLQRKIDALNATTVIPTTQGAAYQISKRIDKKLV